MLVQLISRSLGISRSNPSLLEHRTYTGHTATYTRVQTRYPPSYTHGVRRRTPTEHITPIIPVTLRFAPSSNCECNCNLRGIVTNTHKHIYIHSSYTIPRHSITKYARKPGRLPRCLRQLLDYTRLRCCYLVQSFGPARHTRARVHKLTPNPNKLRISWPLNY